MSYKFNPEKEVRYLLNYTKEWFNLVHKTKCVIGISGGKDSSIAAKLMSEALGKDNVIGVMMPNGIQKDISDSKQLIQFLGIPSLAVNIYDANQSIIDQVGDFCVINKDTVINLPPRLRMSTLYAVAQSVDGIVINTCNLSEDIVGYATLYGDSAGSYAPINKLTVTELLQIGDFLGLPYELVHKTPSDGLQDLSDEDKLGIKYSDIDKVIREFDTVDNETLLTVRKKFLANRFKLEMIRIPGPSFKHLPNYFRQFCF